MIDQLVTKIIEVTLYAESPCIQRKKNRKKNCFLILADLRVYIYIYWYFKEFLLSLQVYLDCSDLFSLSLFLFLYLWKCGLFLFFGRTHSRVQLPSKEKDRFVFNDVLHVRHTELHPPALYLDYFIITPGLIILSSSWNNGFERTGCKNYSTRHFQDFLRISFAIGLCFQSDYSLRVIFNRKRRKGNNIISRVNYSKRYIILNN